MKQHLFTSLLLMAAASGALAQTPPSGPPPDGKRKPPPEAVAACQGKTEGATVGFTLRDGIARTGVCKTIDGVLAVAPPDGPPPGGQPRKQQ